MRKAAQQGDSSAEYHLGWAYEQGDGVAQDLAQAVEWYRRSASQGHRFAPFNLASKYESGRGVIQDFVQAHMWMNLAASQANGEELRKIAGFRDYLAERMTSTQIAQAQRFAREWKPVALPQSTK